MSNEEEKEQVEYSHEYSIPNFALAFPYLDLSKPASHVMTQLRGVASYGVFKQDRAKAGENLKKMNVAEQLKRGKK